MTATPIDDVLRRITAEMARQGRSQTEVAKAIGMRQPGLSDVFHGRQQLKAIQLMRIAAYLGKPVSYFTDPAAEEDATPGEMQALVA